MLRRLVMAAGVVALASIGTAQAPVDHFAAPAAGEVRAEVLSWVAEQGVTDKTVLEAVGTLWTVEGEVL
ncbi:MAG TPA: hypothetical protein VML55_24155, partial [Planctomycetaceae bacterium]|nr:hypothetical protein [Planctomycetaceae bacterium]